MRRVLIAGISTRAAAVSAVRAGFDVTSVDGFGDLDQPPSADVRVVPSFTADAAARVCEEVACEAVIYLSNFENHPGAVARLAARGALWGNPPEVLARVRDPVALASAVRARGFATPEVRLKPDITYDPEGRLKPATADDNEGRDWLVKPLASGGGHGVRRWRPGTPIPGGSYLQEFVDGTPGSIVFVAANRRAVVLGVSRQLIGDAAFGASAYRYCGNILAPSGEPSSAYFSEALVTAARALAQAAVEEFDLVGVNGIDFIARADVPYVIEVNPRWCASMELVERALGLPVFAMHAAACSRGELPAPLPPAPAATGTFGKAIVFARDDVEVCGSRVWLDDDTIRDVPPPCTLIPKGRPICTVFGVAHDVDRCHAELVRTASRIYEDVRGA